MSQASSVGTTASEDQLTTVFRLLSRPRRRRALYVLRESDGEVTVDHLADRLAAREADGEGRSGARGDAETTVDGAGDANPGGTAAGDDAVASDRVAAGDGAPAGDGAVPDDARRERVATQLRHVHLPKLAAAGAVEHGSDGAVRYAASDALDDWVARAATAEGA